MIGFRDDDDDDEEFEGAYGIRISSKDPELAAPARAIGRAPETPSTRVVRRWQTLETTTHVRSLEQLQAQVSEYRSQVAELIAQEEEEMEDDQPDTDYPSAADYTRLLGLLDRGMSKGYATLDGDDCAILGLALCAFIQLDKGETNAG